MSRKTMNTGIRRVASVFASFALVLALVPSYAFAASDDTLSSQADVTLPASGTWGTCPWEIDEEGMLTVHPGTGADAVTGIKASPWADYQDLVQTVVFAEENAQKVVAPADSSYLLSDFKQLKKIDVSGLDTSQVKNMSFMFKLCSSLASLGLSGFDTSRVTNMDAMFLQCSSLSSLGLSGFDTSRVTNMSSMFSGCSSLASLDLSGFDTSQVTNMRSMFLNCSSLASLDLSGFDTSQVTDMKNMFINCSLLKNLDLEFFDTSQATNMERMFQGCSSLASLDLSGFDTSRVTNMDDMFSGCSSLASLDLSGFDTSRVTNMSSMFSGCSSLASLDLSGFDTSQVMGMSRIFWDCSSLTSLDLSGFDTSQAKNMRSMFQGCSSLASLDLSGFDTSRATDMGGMFWNCSSLASLDLSGFNTSRVMNMDDMFSGCSSLASLDLSGFNTSRVDDMGDMFSHCNALKVVSLGDEFSFKGHSVRVLTTLPEGQWFSSTQHKYLTSQEIADAQPGTLGTCSIPPTEVPSIIKGDRGVWASNEAEGLSFESDAAYELFIGVRVDDNEIDETYYTVSEGSIIVELKPTYLATLAPGEHTISIVSATGTSEAAAQASFMVLGSIASAEISLDHKQSTYDGTQKRPAVSANAGEVMLEEGVDYTVSYPDVSVNVGSYTVTVTGIGNYSGTKTVSYEITPASITDIALGETEYTFDGAQKRPSVTVKCGDKVLVADVDYTVTYPASSSTVGTYMVTVAGKGNYTGTKQATFEIVEASKPTPDEPKPDDPGAIDPKPDDPGTQPDNPGTTDPDPGNPGTQPEDPGTTDPQPDDPGAVAPGPVAAQVMYRAYNPNSGEHFYTASYGEVESIVAVGWQYEGEAWTAPVTSAVPVYRLYSGTDHHYTTSAYERDELLKVGWSDEGIGWYSDDNEGVGLHRLFNPNVDPNAPRNNSGSHHYTTSEVERDHLVSIGWRYEHYGWYGVR